MKIGIVLSTNDPEDVWKAFRAGPLGYAPYRQQAWELGWVLHGETS